MSTCPISPFIRYPALLKLAAHQVDQKESVFKDGEAGRAFLFATSPTNICKLLGIQLPPGRACRDCYEPLGATAQCNKVLDDTERYAPNPCWLCGCSLLTKRAVNRADVGDPRYPQCEHIIPALRAIFFAGLVSTGPIVNRLAVFKNIANSGIMRNILPQNYLWAHAICNGSAGKSDILLIEASQPVPNANYYYVPSITEIKKLAIKIYDPDIRQKVCGPSRIAAQLFTGNPNILSLVDRGEITLPRSFDAAMNELNKQIENRLNYIQLQEAETAQSVGAAAPTQQAMTKIFRAHYVMFKGVVEKDLAAAEQHATTLKAKEAAAYRAGARSIVVAQLRYYLAVLLPCARCNLELRDAEKYIQEIHPNADMNPSGALFKYMAEYSLQILKVHLTDVANESMLNDAEQELKKMALATEGMVLPAASSTPTTAPTKAKEYLAHVTTTSLISDTPSVIATESIEGPIIEWPLINGIIPGVFIKWNVTPELQLPSFNILKATDGKEITIPVTSLQVGTTVERIMTDAQKIQTQQAVFLNKQKKAAAALEKAASAKREAHAALVKVMNAYSEQLQYVMTEAEATQYADQIANQVSSSLLPHTTTGQPVSGRRASAGIGTEFINIMKRAMELANAQADNWGDWKRTCYQLRNFYLKLVFLITFITGMIDAAEHNKVPQLLNNVPFIENITALAKQKAVQVDVETKEKASGLWRTLQAMQSPTSISARNVNDRLLVVLRHTIQQIDDVFLLFLMTMQECSRQLGDGVMCADAKKAKTDVDAVTGLYNCYSNVYSEDPQFKKSMDELKVSVEKIREVVPGILPLIAVALGIGTTSQEQQAVLEKYRQFAQAMFTSPAAAASRAEAAAPEAQLVDPAHSFMRLMRFYARYSPDKATVENVKNTLLRYAGHEEVLFERLVKQYGPEPPSSWRPHMNGGHRKIGTRNKKKKRKQKRTRYKRRRLKRKRTRIVRRRRRKRRTRKR